MTTESITGWAVLVPGTMEPASTLSSDLATGTRQYIVFCDPDGKEQAEKVAERYPEGQRFVTEVAIIKRKRLFNRN